MLPYSVVLANDAVDELLDYVMYKQGRQEVGQIQDFDLYDR